MKKIYSLSKTIVDVKTLETVDVPAYRFFSSLESVKNIIKIISPDAVFIKETDSFIHACECVDDTNTYYFAYEYDLED